MEIKSKPIQRIEEQGKPKVMGVNGYKTYRKALQVLIGKHYKQKNPELEFYTRGLLELYNKFHPEKIAEVEVKGWHGKSSFELIKELDKLIIVKYQRTDKESEPEEIRIEATREELEALIWVLKRLSKLMIEIPTREIAVLFSYRLNLGIRTWKEFFAERHWHNKLTLMLNALQELKLIKYLGGKTTLLEENISIQTIL